MAAVGVSFQPLNQTAKAEALQKLNYYVEGLRRLTPDSGAYMNEVCACRRGQTIPKRTKRSQADPEEPDWQYQFWGDNYPSLLSIKRAVDPDDVLWCDPCVGNERWREVGNQLCRVNFSAHRDTWLLNMQRRRNSI
jgi:hypothetical protein